MCKNTQQTGLSKRVLAILNDFEKQGHDVELLLQKAIDHLHAEIMLGAIFDTDSKRIVKIKEHQIDANRLAILHQRLIKMESIKDQWRELHA
jgi:hypothetical protein